MDPHDFDRFTRHLVSKPSRRCLLKGYLALGAGAAVLLIEQHPAAANHNTKHCTKLGKKCKKHKDCCGGVCGAEEICVTCDGVLAWAGTTLARTTVLLRLTESIISDITTMASHGFSGETVAEIADTTGAIRTLDEAIRTEVNPLAAGSITRSLVEAFAAELDALSRYLDQVYEEAFIETGNDALDALRPIIEALPSIEVEIAVLRDACDR